MKKKLYRALCLLIVLTPLERLYADDSSKHEILTTRIFGTVVGLYGLHTMVAFKRNALIRNIFRIPVGGFVATVGFSSAFFAKELVAHLEVIHDTLIEESLNHKLKHNSSEYTWQDGLDHINYTIKRAFRGK